MLDDEQLRARIAARLEALSRSPITAAVKGGLERSYIRDFLKTKKSSIKSRYYEGIAVGLDWTVAELIGEQPVADPGASVSAAASSESGMRAGAASGTSATSAGRAPPALPGFATMAQDVPVKGNAAGGQAVDFYFNGQTIDFVRRPPGVARSAGVFALYVTGNSMHPRYTEGELIYATSARPASIGDYVVVELWPEHDGGDTPGYIKRLEKRTPTKIVCSQFNPEKSLEFDLKRVKAVHRVIPWAELLGG